jgi:hypothetical protein
MSDSSSSTLSNMLSMGEDLKDEKEKGHLEFKDHLHHKMLIIHFPCQALHFITSIGKDDNSLLILSLFISF